MWEVRAVKILHLSLTRYIAYTTAFATAQATIYTVFQKKLGHQPHMYIIDNQSQFSVDF